MYEGNGDTSNDTYISNVGIDLETSGGLVWVKARTNYNHLLMDSVRGTSSLTSNDTTTQRTNYNRFKSYEGNGFMIRANNAADLYKINRTGNDFVAWVWKGGGAAVTDSSTGTISTDISANTDAGFSIATYTGAGYPNSTTAEVPHGLTQAPELVIIKGTGGTGQSSGAGSWVVGSSLLGSGWDGSMYLNSDAAYYTTVNYFWNGAATNSVVKLKNDWFVNGNNNNYVMYSWHSIAGYSKIGTYIGSNPTKTTVTLGFEPSWIMIKSTSHAYNWYILDNKRSPTGNWDEYLYANTSAAEGTSGGNWIKPTSNGFETNATGGSVTNANGVNYVYMAFK